MKASSMLRPSRRSVLAGTSCLFVSHAFGERAIPDDNLAYPVMVTLKPKNGPAMGGSGFYLNNPDTLYFVTAKHVIFPPPNSQLVDAELELMSYSKELSAQGRVIITASLSKLNVGGNIRAHEHRDVAVIKIATINRIASNTISPSNSTTP